MKTDKDSDFSVMQLVYETKKLRVRVFTPDDTQDAYFEFDEIHQDFFPPLSHFSLIPDGFL
ncbi:MAG: hypothetical protein AAGE96_16115 [Cyanobacteria bacterium P01_G01_bin.19]